jgi:hypothetical protein
LQRYVFANLNEIFFANFLNVFTEWLQRLAEKNKTLCIVVEMNWTHELIQQLNTISNQISRVVDFWLNSILGSYITEFAIDCTQSYSIVERDFCKVPC